MITISRLFIYPIKSLGGIEIFNTQITLRGLEHDRRWMLVDDNNEFLTQRIYPEMALLKPEINGAFIFIHHLTDPSDKVMLPLNPALKPTTEVKIWDDYCEAQYAEQDVNDWFSAKLGISCKAVFMPEAVERKLDPRYAISEKDITGFSDGYPILMISEASLEDLNSRLKEAVPMDRFRPNIVIRGTAPFAEDEMKRFSINQINFYGVKLCGRCPVTTINQQTGARSKEPLKTLATYRTIHKKVCFGQNVICQQGEIAVGDIVHTNHEI